MLDLKFVIYFDNKFTDNNNRNYYKNYLTTVPVPTMSGFKQLSQYLTGLLLRSKLFQFSRAPTRKMSSCVSPI